jgi:hypothetical protein
MVVGAHAARAALATRRSRWRPLVVAGRQKPRRLCPVRLSRCDTSRPPLGLRGDCWPDTPGRLCAAALRGTSVRKAERAVPWRPCPEHAAARYVWPHGPWRATRVQNSTRPCRFGRCPLGQPPRLAVGPRDPGSPPGWRIDARTCRSLRRPSEHDLEDRERSSLEGAASRVRVSIAERAINLRGGQP